MRLMILEVSVPFIKVLRECLGMHLCSFSDKRNRSISQAVLPTATKATKVHKYSNEKFNILRIEVRTLSISQRAHISLVQLELERNDLNSVTSVTFLFSLNIHRQIR